MSLHVHKIFMDIALSQVQQSLHIPNKLFSDAIYDEEKLRLLDKAISFQLLSLVGSYDGYL